MKTINVPIKSISDFKSAPMRVFNEAEEKNNVVYILNRNKVVGVVLTQGQYESIHSEIDGLYDRIDEFTAKERLSNPDRGRIPADEVIGKDLSEIVVRENDGWE